MKWKIHYFLEFSAPSFEEIKYEERNNTDYFRGTLADVYSLVTRIDIIASFCVIWVFQIYNLTSFEFWVFLEFLEFEEFK